MDIEEIKSLIDILEGTDVTELAIEEDEAKIKIKKGPEKVKTVQTMPAQPAPAAGPARGQEQAEDGDEEGSGDVAKDGNVITAPMVGTFYRAPAPDADPFVEVGDVIETGATLCIIEAMKLMNEIEAETEGRIVEIMVDDGEPVEYGQPLFRVEKA
ncbi:MAG: acetyl-CoA carboxylase biotin carboxyl carrier protein [Halanaerobiaceae bacterium]